MPDYTNSDFFLKTHCLKVHSCCSKMFTSHQTSGPNAEKRRKLDISKSFLPCTKIFVILSLPQHNIKIFDNEKKTKNATLSFVFARKSKSSSPKFFFHDICNLPNDQKLKFLHSPYLFKWVILTCFLYHFHVTITSEEFNSMKKMDFFNME